MPKRIRNLNNNVVQVAGSGPIIHGSQITSRVYDIVRDYLASKSIPARKVLPSLVTPYVQEQDATLRRLKKVLVDKAVADAVKRIADEQLAEEDNGTSGGNNNSGVEQIDLESDFEGLDEHDLMEVKDTNSLNKSIVGLWQTENNTANEEPTVPTSEPALHIPEEPQPQPQLSQKQQQSIKKKRDRTSNISGNVSKKQKPATTFDEDRSPPSHVRLTDIGGMDHIVAEILELVAMPISHPEVYLHTGIHPPRGVLLHGPPGCGKTMLANAIAGELGIPFISLSAPSVVSGMSGESEKKIREIFEEARTIAPCIIFLDEIDAITPKRENAQREMERRIVAQLLTCIDELSLDNTDGKVVMVLGATNRPDSIDEALRRAGRFDREIQMTVPDEISREAILRVLSKKLRLTGDFDFKQLAKMTSGYVGADLNALTTAAGIAAIKRIFKELQGSELKIKEVESVEDGAGTVVSNGVAAKSDLSAVNEEDQMDIDVIEVDDDNDDADIPLPQKIKHDEERQEVSVIQQFLKSYPDPLTENELQSLSITIDDFMTALPTVQPSSKREGFATIPNVTWDDVGALQRVRVELQMAIVQPIKQPEIYAQVGITAPAGVLLWGPPGCGKTLLAKAVANESRANFISVRGPELFNKYVGESERAVRQVFNRARASVPCVIFFDEIDALVPRRDDSNNDSSSRVVNTLLTELDGLNDRKGIYVIAATNRPDMIDPAMLRPGRLDKPLFVELPTADERAAILKTVSKKTPVADDVNLDTLAADQRCKNFSGADLAALVREAAVLALRAAVLNSTGLEISPTTVAAKHGGEEESQKVIKVLNENFDLAFRNVKPSVSDRDRDRYRRLGKDFGWRD
ncbi:P-loop containing nucleoside triphosphate hydrolase protein [Lipomyces japonicus]|uniref:P-loop containing nucleoside triphosphate hydrolase protein n=1 Tax=Lipomyces japonicus TaxID=56871 RepID=UPI0034CD6DF0